MAAFAHMRTVMREALVVLVAALLVLRGVAMPMVMTGSEPGMIAFCLNGQIVYASWDGDTPGQASDQVDPCPYLGVTAAVEGVDLTPVAPWRALDVVDVPMAHAAVAEAPLRHGYLSRAPPLAI